jgi:hypothetical protein
MPTYQNARKCLSAIAARYRLLESYVDEGFVRPYGSSGPKNCWFDTQFSRPGCFRFQFSTPHPYPPLRHLVTRTVIGSDGTTPYFSTEYPGAVPKTDIEASLALAVAGATGISRGTAHTIGNLLLESVGGVSPLIMNRPRFRRSRVFEGEHCGRITGIHPRGGRITVWFGTSDLLLRKVVNHTFRREEVRKNIRIDQSPDQAAFRLPIA